MTNTSPTDYPIPISWYQVAWSHELKRKKIKAVTIGGLPLVIFRTDDGSLYALDAHCPHLGAHLAVNGCVHNNRIKCGFHGWEFDGQGRCQKIPQGAKITPNMRTRSWRVEEHYGIIFVLFDPLGTAPNLKFTRVTHLDNGHFGKLVQKTHDINTRHSDVLENGIDMQHFTTVHGVPMNNPQIGNDPNGGLYFRHQTVTNRLGLRFNTMMEISYLHPGLQIIHLHNVLGRECIMLSSVTPINNHLVRAHFTTQVRKGRFSLYTTMLTRSLSYFISSTFAQDIPIWNAKIYKTKPILAKGDEGIQRLRHWYQSFPSVTPSLLMNHEARATA